MMQGKLKNIYRMAGVLVKKGVITFLNHGDTVAQRVTEYILTLSILNLNRVPLCRCASVVNALPASSHQRLFLRWQVRHSVRAMPFACNGL